MGDVNITPLSIGPIVLGAIKTQLPAPAADIADLLSRAGGTTTILRGHATLGLETVVCLDQAVVAQHAKRDIVPEGRVQRAGGRPRAVDVVGVAGVVLVLPDGGVPGEGFGHVGEVGLDVHDLKGVGVDGVVLVAGIEAGEGRDGGADEGHRQGFAVVDGEGVADGAGETAGEVVVEDLELVLVRVAEEDAGDGVGGVAADDAVEQRGRVGEVVRAVVTG